jgi:hypothetical protein
VSHMRPEDHERVSPAIQACRNAGLPVIDRDSCTCGLGGQLVVLAGPDGLRVVCPYDQPCPVHGLQPVATRAVPNVVRKLAAQLDVLFLQDVALVQRLNAAKARLQAANDRLWWGLHPDGLAALYGEHPAAVEFAFAEHRSEVLGAPDPLAAIQQVHWTVHKAFLDYQTAAEERRQLAADIGEVIRQFVDVLIAAGWSEEQARNANVHQLATTDPASQRGN